MHPARSLECAARSLFVVLWASSFLHAQTPPCSDLAARGVHPQPAGMFDLEVARRYEKQSRWKEAEQQYLQAGRVGAPCLRKEALAAIERLSVHHTSDEENFESDLGKFYEDIQDWKDAEQHYAAGAMDAPKPIRDRALQNIAKAQEHLWFEDRVHDLDRWLGYFARALALMYLLVLLWRVRKMRRGIQVVPFEVSNEEANKRLIFSLSSAREELPSLLSPVLTTMGANVVDPLPLIVLPGVENEFPDPAEDLEVGEVKLPLANWIRFFNRSAIRVSGRWQVGQTTGTIQGRILRRVFPLTYSQSRLIFARIDATASDAQDRQLLFFGYDVLVKAIFSRRYGP
jgi:hypothetical protein